MNTGVVFIQVVILTIMMAIGFVLGKIGYLKKEHSDLLTRLLLDLFFPCSVLASASNSYDTGSIGQTRLIVFVYFAMLILFTGLARILAWMLRMNEDDMLVFTRSIGYPNNGFMGLPLCTAVFGAQGTLWASLSVPGTTIYMFTILMLCFSREEKGNLTKQIKSLINPMNLSAIVMIVMLATRWKLPSFLTQVCSSLGNCVAPVAMLVVGYLLSENPLADALKEFRLYLITILRNIVCPLIGAVLLRFSGWDRNMCMCLVMVMGCSVASSVSIFAARYDRSPKFASQSMLQSSLLLPLTMPFVMVLAEKILQYAKNMPCLS